MPDPRGPAFALSVDELGGYLVVTAEELVVGHARATGIDLPFLADVGDRHARLRREVSFRGGARWCVAPVGGERVTVGEELVGEELRALADGERVELGVNLAFRFRRPDPGSTTAVLELERGAECLGNRGVVLFGEGAAGVLRLGPTAGCHLRSALLSGEVELRRDALRLSVTGEGLGEAPALALELPPVERIDLRLGCTATGGPPFHLGIAPLERP